MAAPENSSPSQPARRLPTGPLLALAAVAGYVILAVQGGILSLSVLTWLAAAPVALAAWVFGMRAGALVAALLALLNIAILAILVPLTVSSAVDAVGATMALLLLGVALGRLQELDAQAAAQQRTLDQAQEALEAEEHRREKGEAALLQARSDLERSALERMQALGAANEELQHRLAGRKALEHSLRMSEARFRAAFEGATVGMALVDADAHPVQTNAALQEMLGYSAVELSGMTIFQFTHAQDVPSCREFFSAMTTGTIHDFHLEVRYIRRDGTIVWGDLSMSSVPEENDGPFYISMMEDITERKRAEERLRYLSSHDTLTDAYNRSYFEEEMARMERSRDYPISIVVADVDSLKTVNDTLGHAVGDELLRRAAGIMAMGFRSGDIVARVGGDEFAVLLPRTTEAVAQNTLERIRRSVEVHAHAYPGPKLSLSLGVATAYKGQRMTDVMRQADRRMYEDKARHGRNAEAQ